VALSERMGSIGRSGATELGNCVHKGLISVPLSSALVFCTEDEDSTSLRNVGKLLPGTLRNVPGGSNFDLDECMFKTVT
jgi:hypothetical protein